MSEGSRLKRFYRYLSFHGGNDWYASLVFLMLVVALAGILLAIAAFLTTAVADDLFKLPFCFQQKCVERAMKTLSFPY